MRPCRCEALSDSAYKDDVLILAGDVSDDQAVLRSTFQIMVQKFKHVFFVPGNHDLWVRRKERDVLDSLGEDCCCIGPYTAHLPLLLVFSKQHSPIMICNLFAVLRLLAVHLCEEAWTCPKHQCDSFIRICWFDRRALHCREAGSHQEPVP